MMKIYAKLKQPVIIAAIYMVALYVGAIYFRLDGDYSREMIRLGWLVSGFVVPHLIVLMAFGAKPRLSNLVITVMILALLADLDASAVLMASLGLVTALIKTIVRVKHQPIFNPAAAGLMVMSIFGLSTTWWGVSFAPRLPIFNMSVAMLLTLPIGLGLIVLYKKLPTLIGTSVAFMGVYFLMAGRMPWTILLEGTFAFFLMFMATEPKTSPVVDWQEWIYGLFLGGLLAMMFVEKWSGSPYLVALLGMNVIFSGYKWLQLRLA